MAILTDIFTLHLKTVHLFQDDNDYLLNILFFFYSYLQSLHPHPQDHILSAKWSNKSQGNVIYIKRHINYFFQLRPSSNGSVKQKEVTNDCQKMPNIISKNSIISIYRSWSCYYLVPTPPPFPSGRDGTKDWWVMILANTLNQESYSDYV